ncbi:MAG: signal recognition particle protein [Treponemataceae bacterium]|nr:MAG: signal recognition particle protein [Treponemataceae bacterium]
MLEKITNTFSDVIRTVSGKSSISEKNIEETVEKIKIALLEADVNLRVVRRFVNATIEEAKGEAVLRAVSPGDQFVKIIYDKITGLLGGGGRALNLKEPNTQSVILLAGLQGAGKTTAAAKLALRLQKDGRRPLLAACDLVRPAAAEQLATLGAKISVPVFRADSAKNADALKCAKDAVTEAKKLGCDTIIVDTAGRMQVDESLMGEIAQLKKALNPDEVLLVVDAMTGQGAVDVAKAFDEALGITGFVLTKFDSDARGGAALSLKSITGKPILFMGTGEKIEDIDVFHPERIASRILGMGDIVSLVEKAQETVDADEAERLQKKIANESFTLEDMLAQFQSVKKMGSIEKMVELIPGLADQAANIDHAEIKHQEAIIQSMTKKERNNHLILGPARRKRIAKGSGTSVAEVNRLIKHFEKTRLMMKKLVKNKKMQNSLMGQFGVSSMPPEFA